MKKFGKILALVMAVLMVFSLVGCGAGNGEKVWIIKTDKNFNPFEYRTADGELVGIDIEILAAIAEDQNFKYTIEDIGWDAAIAACQASQADAMIAGASITEKRKNEGWIFSDGYYTATQCMAVHKDSGITSFADLKDKNVVVKTGTQGAAYAESIKAQYGFTTTYVEDSATMYQSVAGGQAAACFEDTPIMRASIKAGNLALKVVEGTENEGAPYGLAMFKENKEFMDMFNAGLANIKANGKYDAIIAKYLG